MRSLSAFVDIYLLYVKVTNLNCLQNKWVNKAYLNLGMSIVFWNWIFHNGISARNRFQSPCRFSLIFISMIPTIVWSSLTFFGFNFYETLKLMDFYHYRWFEKVSWPTHVVGVFLWDYWSRDRICFTVKEQEDI